MFNGNLLLLYSGILGSVLQTNGMKQSDGEKKSTYDIGNSKTLWIFS